MLEYLKKAAKAYYDGNPIMSDPQFDKLAEAFGFSDVGAKPSGKTGNHVYRMYSLDKYYEGEGKRPLAEYPDSEKVRSPKLDGAAIDILYVDGKLVRVLTRGDGVEGVDITNKFLITSIIPKTIRMAGVIQVIGEICAPKTVENSRNYAAGALNLKDVEEFKTRAISFFAYGIFPHQTSSFSKDMVILKKMGFETIFTPNLYDIYPTDGLVFRLDSYEEFERLGYTSKFPRGAYALKERAEGADTELLDVEWQVSKTGRVTPVAVLAPIVIEDAVITRATLNNKAFIESLGIQIGDIVHVIRAGSIIPCITHKIE